MSTEQTDWQELCRELVDELHSYASANPHHDSDALVLRARAALSQPEPEVGPTDEELIKEAIAVGLAFQPQNEAPEVFLPFDAEEPLDEVLVDFARAVLARWCHPALAADADEPAVPEGREPAAVIGEPSDQDLYDYWISTSPELGCADPVGFARAVLARWGHQPAPPAEGEVEGPTDEEVEVWADQQGFVRGHADHPCGFWIDDGDVGALVRAALSRWGHQPAPVAEGVDRSHISDGYHTFAELYDHRHSLMLALMRAIPKLCWFSQQHADGEMPFGTTEWFIAGVDLPTGAITYHLPSELLSLAQQTGAAELSVGRPWDGHTANDVIERLRAWVASPQPAPPAEGEVGELVAWLRTISKHFRLDQLGDEADRTDRAADLLEQRHPTPVPVSERLPGPGDCDEEGLCWWFSPADPSAGTFGVAACWVLRKHEPEDDFRTHWLPFTALPMPAGEVE